METVYSLKTSIDLYHSTHRHIPEDNNRSESSLWRRKKRLTSQKRGGYWSVAHKCHHILEFNPVTYYDDNPYPAMMSYVHVSPCAAENPQTK
jgi:hypothetical protein